MACSTRCLLKYGRTFVTACAEVGAHHHRLESCGKQRGVSPPLLLGTALPKRQWGAPCRETMVLKSIAHGHRRRCLFGHSSCRRGTAYSPFALQRFGDCGKASHIDEQHPSPPLAVHTQRRTSLSCPRGAPHRRHATMLASTLPTAWIERGRRPMPIWSRRCVIGYVSAALSGSLLVCCCALLLWCIVVLDQMNGERARGSTLSRWESRNSEQ
jgi:hypothetical protein